jgi:hypothetical protein
MPAPLELQRRAAVLWTGNLHSRIPYMAVHGPIRVPLLTPSPPAPPTRPCCLFNSAQQSPVAQQLVAGVSAATVALMVSPLPAMAEVTPSLRCAWEPPPLQWMMCCPLWQHLAVYTRPQLQDGVQLAAASPGR